MWNRSGIIINEVTEDVIFSCVMTYRIDAQKLEEWARAQTSSSLIEFPSRDGEVEGILKDIAERAGGKGGFSYSRFFAVGLFRLLELANATEPTVLEKVESSFLYICWFVVELSAELHTPPHK